MDQHKNYTLVISDEAKSQLNDYQIKFIEMAYQRISDIEDSLDMDLTPPDIRLYLIKDLFTIFNELLKIKKIRKYQSADEDTKRRIQDLIDTVDFIRNVLLHFPLFKTWDDIYISKNFNSEMGGPKGGRIHKFLNPIEPRENLAYKLTMKGGMGERVFTIKFPDEATLDEDVFIKNILSEQEGALSILAIMHHIF